ncbi:MAG: hypothetical protein ABEJ66_00765, partial [Candidatus Nanohaloarchaea archaeon]
LQEGTFGSLEPYADNIIGAAKRDWYLNDLEAAFDNGISAGVDPERDREKMENAGEHDSDAPLFPTMKELGAQRLQDQVMENGEQALYFVRHVDTAEDLDHILPGQTASITGS